MEVKKKAIFMDVHQLCAIDDTARKKGAAVPTKIVQSFREKKIMS